MADDLSSADDELLYLILAAAPMTTAQLAEHRGRPLDDIEASLRRLVAEGYIRAGGVSANQGRTLFTPDPNGAHWGETPAGHKYYWEDDEDQNA